MKAKTRPVGLARFLYEAAMASAIARGDIDVTVAASWKGAHEANREYFKAIARAARKRGAS